MRLSNNSLSGAPRIGRLCSSGNFGLLGDWPHAKLLPFLPMLYSARFRGNSCSASSANRGRSQTFLIALPETFNVATYFVDRNVQQGRGDKIAIECGDEKVSYQQLLERTNRVGNALRKLDVRLEERVLLLLTDTPEFLYCFFGAIKIGAVAVP